MAKKSEGKINWRLVVTIVTFLAFAGLIFAVREQIYDTIGRLGQVNTWALLLMPMTQFLNYSSYTQMYQAVFAILGTHIRYWPMMRVVSELNFVNNVFPSGGVSGFSYMGLRMKSFDVTPGQSTLAQMMRFVLIFASFEVLLLVGLFLLAIGGQASNLMILVAGSLATILVVLTLAIMFVASSEKRIQSVAAFVTRYINRAYRKIRRKKSEDLLPQEKVRETLQEFHNNYVILKDNYRKLKKPLISALLANIGEVMTIYVVYAAFGEFVNPGAVIIAYAIANFAGLISVLPGGIGIYETLMTTVLVTAGIPASLSIPVTIMYRVLNMSLQLPVGYYFYHRTISKNKALEVS